ncbi:hypothetical protein ACTWJ8_40305 (plasmid) [Streptomyces sp. SDT5-1]|uniref:hypothetical protein n=1 Tax=Streptomyces sp. SDT5-1 TaxID=3406418 RepID=UPI003FD2E6BC
MLGHTFRVTTDELKEIFTRRIAPYLPAQFEKAEPHPSGWGNSYTFKPFTGAEPKPEEPYDRYSKDLKLAYKFEDEFHGREVATEDEYELREKARHFLDQVYDEARTRWRNAKYVRDLKQILGNGEATAAWKRWEQAQRAADAAYGYLRKPEATPEWQSAVARLLDTHKELAAAAEAFDAKAERIAWAHKENSCEEGYGYVEALREAGFPEAAEWHVAEPEDYAPTYGYRAREAKNLQAQAASLIKSHEDDVAKIGRLSGAPASA